MKKAVLILGILAAFLIWQVVHHTGQIGFELLCGWPDYLRRVLPEVTLRWDGLAWFGLALLAFVGLLHYLLRTLRPTRADELAEPNSPWHWRWTLCIATVVLLMFAAGIAMVGVAHQTAWMASTDEPLFVAVFKQSDGITSGMNLKHVIFGVATYQDTYKAYPSTRARNPDEARHSWITKILPYASYYAGEIDFTRPFNDPVNAPAFRRVVPILINPELVTDQIVDSQGFALSHYAGNSRILGDIERVSAQRLENPAQTILLGEVNADFAPWGDPNNCRDPAVGINTPGGFGGASSSGGAQFAMADGSVRFFTAKVDPKILRALSDPDTTPTDNATSDDHQP